MRAAVALAAVAAFAALAAVAGCVLVTGGTNGYTAAEAGSLAGLGCQTPKDCNGGACCIDVDASVPTTMCQATCPPSLQACAVGSDCGDAGECLTQSCMIEGMTVQVTTCAPISACTQ